MAPTAERKEPRVFAWPFNLLPRNASHEEIVRAWENGPQPDPQDEDGGSLYGVEYTRPRNLPSG